MHRRRAHCRKTNYRDPWARESEALRWFGIYERLVSCITAPRYASSERCVFVLGEAERFLKDQGDAPLMKFIGGRSKEIQARNINQMRVEMAP